MRAPTKRPKAPKRNKTQPSSGSASKAKTKGGGLFGFPKIKTGSKKGPVRSKGTPKSSKPARKPRRGVPAETPIDDSGMFKGREKLPARKPRKGFTEAPIDDSGMFGGREKLPAPKGRTNFTIQRTPEESAKREARIQANKRKAARAAAKRKKAESSKVPPLKGKKPVRGKGPAKPPVREVGNPTLDKPKRGRRKPTPTPMPTKPGRGRRKPMPIGGGRNVPFRGAMSRRRTR